MLNASSTIKRCDAHLSRHKSSQPSSILAPVHVQVKDSRKDQIMKIVTYSEARSSLKAVLDDVHDDADVTVISRRDGADTVVMSFDYYQSIMATLHLLASPAKEYWGQIPIPIMQKSPGLLRTAHAALFFYSFSRTYSLGCRGILLRDNWGQIPIPIMQKLSALLPSPPCKGHHWFCYGYCTQRYLCYSCFRTYSLGCSRILPIF